jgi:hypothetical protein
MSYIAGDGYFCCDRCGSQRRWSERRKEWTNLIVCPECLDPRPAELSPPDVRAEGLPIRDARPEPDAIELEPNDVTREDI